MFQPKQHLCLVDTYTVFVLLSGNEYFVSVIRFRLFFFRLGSRQRRPVRTLCRHAPTAHNQGVERPPLLLQRVTFFQ
ncbi:hypothetical protein HYQ46_002564 [Verticillium longisporum]|nr:hypothetical protein HYQ46_002564 [Verticillium longisporum]